MSSANWFENLLSSVGRTETATHTQKGHAPKRIRANEFRALQAEKPELLFLDVRTAEEYRATRIPGSKLLPVHELNARKSQLPTDKDHPIVVYCQSGARSGQAAHTLARLGYTQVYDLGSIMSWPYERISG